MTTRRPDPGSRSTAGGAARPRTTHHMTDSRGAAPAVTPSTLASRQGTPLITNDTAVMTDDEGRRTELYVQMQRDRARFHVTLGAFRGALEDEPSPALVRATGRRWINAAVQAIEEVAKAMHDQNKDGGR